MKQTDLISMIANSDKKLVIIAESLQQEISELRKEIFTLREELHNHIKEFDAHKEPIVRGGE